MNNHFDTGMYIIDKEYKILNVNQALSNMYPEVKVGDICYRALAMQDSPCSTCPLVNNDVLFFNPIRKEWISANAAEIDYPGHGICYNVQFKMRKSIGGTKRELIHLEKIDEHISELQSATGEECVLGAYIEPGSPIFFANEQMVALLGYDSLDEMMDAIDGMVVNMVHPDDRKRVRQDLAGLDVPGTTFSTTYRTQRKDGAWIWIIMKGRSILTSSGQLANVCVCSDITTFLKYHEELQENSRKVLASRDELLAIASKDQILSEITQALYSYNLTLNLKTGKYSLIVGTGLEEYVAFFRTSEDYEKAFYFNMANTDAEFRKSFEDLTGLENLRRMTGWKGFVGSLEYSANLSGTPEWHEMNVFISTNEFGEDMANLLCRDITEAHNRQEVKEKELRAAVSKDQILSEITKMLYSYNLTLNLKTGKYSLIEGTGLEHVTEVFRATDDYHVAFDRVSSYVDPAWLEEFRALASLKNLRSMRDEKGFVRSLEYGSIVDGTKEWHEINVFMGTNEQGEDIANLLGRDVTEAYERANTKNQLEVAQASNDAKTRFLSNMSHDIRTPINAIMGMLHIAQSNRGDEARVDDCLKKIEISTNYLLTLLNDILDINKLESGRAEPDNEPFNIGDLIDDIFSIIQPTAQMADIRLQKTCGGFAHPDVIGSPLHLRQILMNLISNSIKYSKQNGTASILVEELDANGDEVNYRFVVSDDGIGMSEEFQQKMFDMFEQEYGGARTIHKGSGLGLAIVKMLVDLLGGKLSVQSEQNRGSTFTVILPFQINLDPAPTLHAEVCDTTDCLKDVRILIVEDNDFNMEIAKVILEETGAVTFPAENGRIALERFAGAPPDTFDAILMDVMMPEMDGLDAIRALDRPDAKTIPIIAMTANAFAEDVKKSLDAGMNEHIAKPLDMATLALTIAKLVKS